MMPDLISEIDSKLNTYVVVKPKYMDFKDQNGIREYVGKKPTFGEGVFGIIKELFIERCR